MGFDRQNYTYDSQTPRESMSGMKMLWILIAINIAAYFFVGKNNENFFALTIAQGSKVFQLRYIWQIFTAGFLHDGFLLVSHMYNILSRSIRTASNFQPIIPYNSAFVYSII